MDTNAKRKLSLFGESQPEPFSVQFTPFNNGRFSVFINGEIQSPAQFENAVTALSMASEGDIVEIHLQSPGGDLDATDLFLQAMRECEGRVIVRATGGCHSAASIILMNAPEFTLSPGFSCLIHNGSVGNGGKFSDYVAASRHIAAHMEQVMRQSYEGFLTDSEIDELIAGKDFWLGPEEFSERAQRRNAYFQLKNSLDSDDEEE